jgi:hypothetical protein
MKKYSNILISLAAITIAGSGSASTLLLSDNFDTTNNDDITQNLVTRQAGTLATASYTESSGSATIASNQLSIGFSGSVTNAADLRTAFTAAPGTVFSISYDFRNTGTNWVSTYLDGNTGANERGSSPFGFHVQKKGGHTDSRDINSIALTYYSGGFNAQVTGQHLLLDNLETTLGVAFDASLNHNYQMLATSTTTTTGTYDILIDGTVVVADLAYDFGTSGAYLTSNAINWASTTNTDGAGNYDNLNISIVPEPSTTALFGLGGLALILRRRR